MVAAQKFSPTDAGAEGTAQRKPRAPIKSSQKRELEADRHRPGHQQTKHVNLSQMLFKKIAYSLLISARWLAETSFPTAHRNGADSEAFGQVKLKKVQFQALVSDIGCHRWINAAGQFPGFPVPRVRRPGHSDSDGG